MYITLPSRLRLSPVAQEWWRSLRSSVKVWHCSRTEAEPGLGHAGPGARRLGSTGALGRRARWVDKQAKPTGTLGRRARGGAEEANGSRLNSNVPVPLIKRGALNKFEIWFIEGIDYPTRVSLCHPRELEYFHEVMRATDCSQSAELHFI